MIKLHDQQRKVVQNKKCTNCFTTLDFRNKTGLCLSCYHKSHTKRTKEEINEYQKQWKKNNKHLVRKYQKKTYLKNRDKYIKLSKKSTLKRKFGMSVEDYKKKFYDCNGVCEICGKKQENKLLSVDHNHKSGNVRGLLCTKCNLSLGGFCDDVGIIKNAIEYLNKYKEV